MFFTFEQNQSNGFLIDNSSVTEQVVIEADNYWEANERAREIGLYFDGVADGIDCDCCGDRWFRAWKTDETSDPVFDPGRKHLVYFSSNR